MIPHLLAIGLGALGWTLAEYVLHRFDGHGMRGRTRFSRVHLAHHTDPMWFAPASEKAAVAALVVPSVAGLGWLLAGGFGLTFAAAFLAMYLTYEVLHRRIHTHAGVGYYAHWARRHHLQHHFGSPKHNHGVTTSLWDHVFRTWVSSEQVRVPRRHAPVWMVDADGQLLPEWSERYELRGRIPRDSAQQAAAV